jgi:hypothetical protein
MVTMSDFAAPALTEEAKALDEKKKYKNVEKKIRDCLILVVFDVRLLKARTMSEPSKVT